MDRRALLKLPCAALLLAACGRRQRLGALPAGTAVLAFGDSVTYGTGAAPGEDWPSRLAALTGWHIANAGVPGDTASAARDRLPEALASARPALVLLELGGNDFLRRQPAPAVKENLRSLIRMTRAAGAQVVLVGVPELSLLAVVARRPADSPIYAALAAEEKIPLVPDVFSRVLARPEWCADSIHPNAEGYREMAIGIHAALRDIGLAR